MGGNDSIALRSAAEAQQHLGSIVAALNTNFGGRTLFSGTATGTAPISSADDIIDALRTELSGVVGGPAKIAAAEAWFDSPTGFDAIIYQGSQDALAPFRMSQVENLELDVRVTDGAIKDTLRHVAMAALSDDVALGINAQERQAILSASGQGLLGSQDSLVSLRATIGTTQARMDQIMTRNASEKLSLDFARSSLLAADPFETATRLEEVQFQLQSLYTLTVKSSQLSLVNFL
jgi:flagellar hook-associated protein 3 FlgL